MAYSYIYIFFSYCLSHIWNVHDTSTVPGSPLSTLANETTFFMDFLRRKGPLTFQETWHLNWVCYLAKICSLKPYTVLRYLTSLRMMYPCSTTLHFCYSIENLPCLATLYKRPWTRWHTPPLKWAPLHMPLYWTPDWLGRSLWLLLFSFHLKMKTKYVSIEMLYIPEHALVNVSQWYWHLTLIDLWPWWEQNMFVKWCIFLIIQNHVSFIHDLNILLLLIYYRIIMKTRYVGEML